MRSTRSITKKTIQPIATASTEPKQPANIIQPGIDDNKDMSPPDTDCTRPTLVSGPDTPPKFHAMENCNMVSPIGDLNLDSTLLNQTTTTPTVSIESTPVDQLTNSTHYTKALNKSEHDKKRMNVPNTEDDSKANSKIPRKSRMIIHPGAPAFHTDPYSQSKDK
jgi:hypothetical protein